MYSSMSGILGSVILINKNYIITIIIPYHHIISSIFVVVAFILPNFRDSSEQSDVHLFI